MTTQLKHTLALFFVVFAFACQQYRPIIDSYGLDKALLEQHMADCSALADQTVNYTSRIDIVGGLLAFASTISGAMGGAIVDGFLNNWGSKGYSGDHWTIAGGAAGLASGLAGALSVGRNTSQNPRKTVMDQCMEKRGYDVIQY